MAEYRLTKVGVIRLSDNSYIPENEDNADWIRYQRWLAEGNTPEPMGETREDRLARRDAALAARKQRIANATTLEELKTILLEEEEPGRPDTPGRNPQ